MTRITNVQLLRNGFAAPLFAAAIELSFVGDEASAADAEALMAQAMTLELECRRSWPEGVMS